MCHDFFSHSSVNGHLGCFCVPAIVNSAAMNIRVHVSFSIIGAACLGVLTLQQNLRQSPNHTGAQCAVTVETEGDFIPPFSPQAPEPPPSPGNVA